MHRFPFACSPMITPDGIRTEFMMDDRRFDNLTREFIVPATHRRRFVKGLLVGLLGVPVFGTSPDVSAKDICRERRRGCIQDADCCSNDCRRGICRGNGTCLPNGPLPEGTTCGPSDVETTAVCCSRTCSTPAIDEGCGLEERCCELANQPKRGVRGFCETHCDCCSGNCVDGRCRSDTG